MHSHEIIKRGNKLLKKIPAHKPSEYDHRPNGYNLRPKGYDHRPSGYDDHGLKGYGHRPSGYDDHRPKGYGQRPQGYGKHDHSPKSHKGKHSNFVSYSTSSSYDSRKPHHGGTHSQGVYGVDGKIVDGYNKYY